MKLLDNIIGVDEVGRGCLFGPVVACALTFKYNTPNDLLEEIKDSKKLSFNKRQQLSLLLQQYCIYSIHAIDSKTIDKVNILQASLLAMFLATNNLLNQNDIKNYNIIIDGNKNFNYLKTETLNNITSAKILTSNAIVKADSKFKAVSAASIIAKNYRDNYIIELSKKYPQYKLESNFGYGTKEHLNAIEKYGITEHHRISFKPIKL